MFGSQPVISFHVEIYHGATRTTLNFRFFLPLIGADNAISAQRAFNPLADIAPNGLLSASLRAGLPQASKPLGAVCTSCGRLAGEFRAINMQNLRPLLLAKERKEGELYSPRSGLQKPFFKEIQEKLIAGEPDTVRRDNGSNLIAKFCDRRPFRQDPRKAARGKLVITYIHRQ
jgi:hypothetical protein